MKEFIFILYVLFILIVPQLYTWLVRMAKGERDVQALFIIIIGLIIGLLTTIFTMLLIQWQIIAITL
jgi:hypothetical protein